MWLSQSPVIFSKEVDGVTLSNSTTTDTDADGSPWTFSVEAKFWQDGTHTYLRGILSNGSYTDWLDTAPDAGSAADFEIRATEVSNTGSATRTGTLDTWLALSSNRSWKIEGSTSGDKTWTLDFEIRDIYSNIVRATARYTLRCIDGFS